MMFLAKTLSFYKRKDIQEELVKHAKSKEIAFRFGDRFGKRPETLSYPNDVLELAKQRVTSFHCSEELWSNPLQLRTDMRREEQDALRKGWDLIFDIDCPSWSLSKIIAWLVIKALKDHGIFSPSVKFSGNKGFHVGLPFESFPKKISGIKVKDMFPEFAIKVMLYLLDYISKTYIKVESNRVIFAGKFKIGIDKLSNVTGENIDRLTYWYCESCKKRLQWKGKEREELIIKSDDVDFATVATIQNLSKKSFFKVKPCDCVDNRYVRLLDTRAILNVDTLLVSSRHLYRMPYSFHEKSQLVSIPIDSEKILEFDKEDAKPENVQVKHPFLDRAVKSSEAEKLWQATFDFQAASDEFKKDEIRKKYEQKQKAYSLPEKAIGEEHFPPCIKLILNGLEDGRKRAVFVLINFLASCGWDYDMIEQRLKEWNEKNHEPLRQQYLVGQLRYARQGKEIKPPPNCDNLGYYKGFNVCRPEELCEQIKNPLQYAKRREKTKTPRKRKHL